MEKLEAAAMLRLCWTKLQVKE